MKKLSGVIFLLLVVVLLTVNITVCGLFRGKDKSAARDSTETDVKTKTAASAESGQGLAATWPEFAKRHEAQTACFEQGWTGPEKGKDFVTPEIEKRTNFLLKYEPVTVSTQEDLNQKLNLMAASGDVPEIFFGATDTYSQSIYSKLGAAGFIWDVAPLIKDYKNIYNLIEPELILYREKGSNANYFIPTQTGKGNDLLHSPPQGLFVREDFIKKLNMNYPSTPEELYTYLKRCKEEIKTVSGKPLIAFTCDENFLGLEWALVYPFWPINPESNPTIGFTFDIHANFKVVNYIYTDSPELMRAAKFVNKLYREGLIDREILTHKRAQFQEKVSTGRVAAMGAPWWDMNSFSDNAKTIVPELMYVAPPPIFDKANGVPKYPDDKWTNWIGCYSALIISKKLPEETVRHFLALLDYLATREGQVLIQVGIENQNFTYNSSGKYVFTDEFKKMTDNLDWNKAASYGVFYWQQFVFNLPVFDDLRAEYPELIREDNRKGWENWKYRRDRYDPTMKPDKTYYFLPGPIEREKLPSIDEARNEMWVKVLLAKSEAEVEKVIHAWGTNCKNLGIDKIAAERQNYLGSLDIGY
ncbi:MAG: extracellular solute-binding protein [Spirochaetota bacterium]